MVPSDRIDVRTRWQTPLTACKDTEFCAISVNPDLSVNVYVWGFEREPQRGSYWCFSWKEQIAFRCTSDFQIQNPPFGPDSCRDWDTGVTCYCENSSWARRSEECAITDLHGRLTHFVILTVTTIIEVLSNEEPSIRELDEDEMAALGLSKQTYVPVFYKDSGESNADSE